MSMEASKRGAAGEDEAVDGDDDGGALEVLELGVLDLAIDLGEGFFAAHGQHGVAEGHQDAEEAEQRDEFGAFEEAQRVLAEIHVAGGGQRRQVRALARRRNRRPR